MADSPSGLRPMRPIARHPFVEEVLPVEGPSDVPAPAPGAPPKPGRWSHAQLMQDLKCDGGTGIYAKAKAANGGKDPVIRSGKSVIGTGGDTDISTGVITLDPNQDRATAAENAIFELTNLSNKAGHAKADADAAAGRLGRDQYVRVKEALEYQGTANVNKAFASCGAAWGAAKGAKSIQDVYAKAKDFDDYYKNYLAVQNPKHIKYYEDVWDNSFKKVYDGAHPSPKHP